MVLSISRQMHVLRYQIQQAFQRHGLPQMASSLTPNWFEIVLVNQGWSGPLELIALLSSDQECRRLNPETTLSLPQSLAIVEHGCIHDSQSPNALIRWVLHISNQAQDNSQVYAQAGIAEYWVFSTAQMVMYAHSVPMDERYQCRKRIHVGEQATLVSIPQLTIRLQEPLPLYFLTRTLSGQKTYAETVVPLQVCI